MDSRTLRLGDKPSRSKQPEPKGLTIAPVIAICHMPHFFDCFKKGPSIGPANPVSIPLVSEVIAICHMPHFFGGFKKCSGVGPAIPHFSQGLKKVTVWALPSANPGNSPLLFASDCHMPHFSQCFKGKIICHTSQG